MFIVMLMRGTYIQYVGKYRIFIFKPGCIKIDRKNKLETF